MEENEKKIYDNNLSEYSSIIKGKMRDRERIKSCLKMFEYFEDYEKCKDLNKVLKGLEKETDNISEY
jgi:hypothetical protein